MMKSVLHALKIIFFSTTILSTHAKTSFPPPDSAENAPQSGALTEDCLFHYAESMETLITHEHSTPPLDLTIQSIKERLQSTQLPPNVSREETENIIDELSHFAFGRYLLQNRGINGEWTQYMVLYPELWKDQPNDLKGDPQTPFERWMMTSCPTMLATQERFQWFQKILQKELKDSAVLASVPCGVMDDLLRLNYEESKNIKLIGIDLDEASLELAQDQAQAMRLGCQSTFICADAWNMPLHNEIDILTSNGLNIYEPNEARLIELFASFFRALKPGGLLVTSFLTPPPVLSPDSPWDFSAIDQEAMTIQRFIFVDILQAKWANYRTEAETRQHLESSGFVDIQIYYDKAKLFPTITARKPS